MFGKVIRGYDVIQKIAQVSVDEKDRPSVPIVISNCGELELRKKPQSAGITESTYYLSRLDLKKLIISDRTQDQGA